MAKEIERKFLVSGDGWRTEAPLLIRQAYLSVDPARSVRVRLVGDRALLTIKGLSKGASRDEFEYAIPVTDAAYLLEHLCLRPRIEKYRHRQVFAGMLWEVDEFLGDNAGLVLAEVELDSEDQPFERPPWLGREVTGDARFFNSSLALRPWRAWDMGEQV